MNISAFMLVSRDDDQFKRAVDSISNQVDDFIAYIDPITLPDCENAVDYLVEHKAKVRIQKQINLNHHHDDITRAVHRGIMTAKHPWVLNLDDDDEAICDIKRDMAPHIEADVGLIFGAKFKQYPGGRRIYVPGKTPENYKELLQVNGTCLLYNRDAVRRIHPNFDVNHWRRFYGDHYGYFWDLKIWYWLQRAGYKLKHCGEPTVIQNVRVREPARRALKGQWPHIARGLERIRLELNP